MQTWSCVMSVVLAAVLVLGSHAGAQCTKIPAISGPCTGKLNLSVTVSLQSHAGTDLDLREVAFMNDGAMQEASNQPITPAAREPLESKNGGH